MLIGFVIPLKSAVVSRDWSKTCRMLDATLNSLVNQSSPQWTAVVVGHECPQGVRALDKGTIPFHELEVPIPPIREGGDFRRGRDFSRARDKLVKVTRGIQLLRSHNVTHWFVLDADDLLHRDLVEVLVKQGLSENDGAVFDAGWIYYPRLGRVVPCETLAGLCGSTFLLPASLVNVPDFPSLALEGLPLNWHSHGDIERFLLDQRSGKVFKPQQRLVAYTMGYGDNFSDEFRGSFVRGLRAWLKPRLKGNKCDLSFRRDFGII